MRRSIPPGRVTTAMRARIGRSDADELRQGKPGNPLRFVLDRQGHGEHGRRRGSVRLRKIQCEQGQRGTLSLDDIGHRRAWQRADDDADTSIARRAERGAKLVGTVIEFDDLDSDVVTARLVGREESFAQGLCR